jgi:hypothetical protein
MNDAIPKIGNVTIHPLPRLCENLGIHYREAVTPSSPTLPRFCGYVGNVAF